MICFVTCFSDLCGRGHLTSKTRSWATPWDFEDMFTKQWCRLGLFFLCFSRLDGLEHIGKLLKRSSRLICIYLLHTNQTNKMKWKIAGIILYLCCTLNRITLRGSRGEIGTYAWRRTPEGSLGKFITSQATKFWSTEVLSSEEAYASRVHQGWLEYWLRASVRKYERPNKESCCNFSDSVL